MHAKVSFYLRLFVSDKDYFSQITILRHLVKDNFIHFLLSDNIICDMHVTFV